MGHMTSLTDAKSQTTRFHYNAAGKVDSVAYPGGAVETFLYNDTTGRLATRTDRKAVVTTYTYDELGRFTGKTYSDGTPPVTYRYDENGHIGYLTTAFNGTAPNLIDTLTWDYDLAGEPLSEQSTKNASVVAYTYEATGQRATVSLGGVLHVSYAYDDDSRLDYMTRGALTFDFGYDNAHRRTSMTYPNGAVTLYDYDALNRLTTLAAARSGTPITSFTYLYEDHVNRTSKQTLDFTEGYSYDPRDQLTGVDRTGASSQRWGFGYDPVGNRLSEQMGNSAVSSTYNEKNQLLTRSAGGSVRWRGDLNEVGTVAFTSATVNGRPARMLPGNVFEADLDMQSGTNTVTLRATDASSNVTTKTYTLDVAATGAAYSYDASGNLETKTEGSDIWHYTWNAENQLIKVEKNSIEIARFAYDPSGRRVEKVAGGVTTAWAYDGDAILRETRGGVTYRFIHGLGIDEPVAREQGSARQYYHADALGGILKMTDAAGAVALTREYDAWGKLEAGGDQPGYAFTGREWDPETGLYYYRARYYDAKVGRFISEDPIGFEGGGNLYAYVAGNPVSVGDPLGLEPGMRAEYCAATGNCSNKPPPKTDSECWWRCMEAGNTFRGPGAASWAAGGGGLLLTWLGYAAAGEAMAIGAFAYEPLLALYCVAECPVGQCAY
jgi:RHS repeat-associated protein